MSGSKRVLITRAEDDAGILAAKIARRRWIPIELPLLRYEVGPELDAFRAACADHPDALWVVTSPRAVPALPDPPPVGLALCVGERTAALVRERGHRVHIQGTGEGGASLGEAITARGLDLSVRPLLWPTAAHRRPELVDWAKEQGALLRPFTVYETVFTEPSTALVASAIPDLAAIIHASPSAVEALALYLKRDKLEWPSVREIAIGPTTAAALSTAGRSHIELADPPGMDGVLTVLGAP